MINALAFYFIAALGVFFQHNIQYIYPWWKSRTFLNVLIFSIPIGLCYLKSWTFFVEQTGSVFFECASCNKLITNQYADIIIRNKNLEPCEKNIKGQIL